MKRWYAQTVEKLYKGSVGERRKHTVFFPGLCKSYVVKKKKDVSEIGTIPVLKRRVGKHQLRWVGQKMPFSIMS